MGLFFNRLWGIPVSLFVSIFNIAVFGLGMWQLGKEFALTTALSTVFYPAALAVRSAREYMAFTWKNGW